MSQFYITEQINQDLQQDTDSGSKHDCFSLTMYPALLNTFSDETEVAGMQRYF